MIDRHEREGGIDCPVGNDDVELMDGVDRLPVWAGCATERIDTQRQAGIAYCSDVDNVPQILNVRQNEIAVVRRRCLDRGRVRHSLYGGIVLTQ